MILQTKSEANIYVMIGFTLRCNFVCRARALNQTSDYRVDGIGADPPDRLHQCN